MYLTPGEIRNAANVLSQCLETEGIWMGNKDFQLNSGKTEWFCVWEAPGTWNLLSLVLDGIAPSQTNPVLNRVFLVVVPRRAFAQFQIVSALDHKALHSVSYALATCCMDYCNVLYHKDTLKEY